MNLQVATRTKPYKGDVMNPRGITTSQVHAALEREPRVNLHRHPIRIASADGTVTLEGEVADVAAKK
ncbi:MAG TPA: hypothetical protein VFO02_04445, partial [Burkholderiales bacterium]|nr:hypothetical protein [Burkholderiales bacterium]